MSYKSYTSTLGELLVRYAEAFDIVGTSQFSVTTAMGSGYDDAQKQASGKYFSYKLNSSTKVFFIDEDGEVVLAEDEYKYDNISTVVGGSSEVIVFENDTTNHYAKTISA